MLLNVWPLPHPPLCCDTDPHPGNILLTPDGRLGLIDYGQIKVLGRRQRRTLARLIIALADGDEDVSPLPNLLTKSHRRVFGGMNQG